MKTGISIALGVIAGFGLGALSIHSLHAQGKPPVYLITEIDVTNQEAYTKEFAPKAQASIKGAGGKFIIIGGSGANAKSITPMDGTPPKRIAIQAWDSQEAINKWYNSAEYQEALKTGRKYATFRRYAVEGQ